MLPVIIVLGLTEGSSRREVAFLIPIATMAVVTDLPFLPGCIRARKHNTWCCLSTSHHECCVCPRVPELVISGRKDHFAYSLIVINFRKFLNPIKIGSWKNSYPVI